MFFFHALPFAGSEDAVWRQGGQAEYSDIWGTLQVLMQWNKHVWPLFLHILPYSNPIRTENAAKTLNCTISYTGFL